MTEVRSFLGLASYYRKFVRNFAEIATPLYRLTEKGRQFKWTNECQLAFDKLKNFLMTPPILAFPDTTQDAGKFILDTDASGVGIGAVLSQVHPDGSERVIAYASRRLSKAESRYCTTRLEMLALVYFMKYFRPYLLGRAFLVRTDHQSLRWLQNFKDADGQLARWQEQLQEFNFECVYRPGSKQSNADGLSRSLQNIELVNALLVANSVDWGRKQANDTDISVIYNLQAQGASKPSAREMAQYSPATRSLWNMWTRLGLENGVLYLRMPDGSRPKLIVPRSEVTMILHQVHEQLGHAGQKKTEAAVRQRFWWPAIHTDVVNHCTKCETCARIKSPIPTVRAPLNPVVTEEPGQRVGVDIMGPLPTTRSGNRYIIVMIDYFTKWAEAIPIKQQDAETVAVAIVNEWIARYGAPVQLYSDQG